MRAGYGMSFEIIKSGQNCYCHSINGSMSMVQHKTVTT